MPRQSTSSLDASTDVSAKESRAFREVLRMFDEDGREVLKRSGDSYMRSGGYISTLSGAVFPNITDADLV
jgi:hypothetical protein